MFDDEEWDPAFDFPMVGDVVTLRTQVELIGVVSEVKTETVLVLTALMGLTRETEWARHRLNYLNLRDLPSAEIAQMPAKAIKLARKRQAELDAAEDREEHREHIAQAVEDANDDKLVERLSFSTEALEEYRLRYAPSNALNAVDFMLKDELKRGKVVLPDSSKPGVEADEHLRIITPSGLVGVISIVEDGKLTVSRVIPPGAETTPFRSRKRRRRRRHRRKAA